MVSVEIGPFKMDKAQVKLKCIWNPLPQPIAFLNKKPSNKQLCTIKPGKQLFDFVFQWKLQVVKNRYVDCGFAWFWWTKVSMLWKSRNFKWGWVHSIFFRGILRRSICFRTKRVENSFCKQNYHRAQRQKEIKVVEKRLLAFLWTKANPGRQ